MRRQKEKATHPHRLPELSAIIHLDNFLLGNLKRVTAEQFILQCNADLVAQDIVMLLEDQPDPRSPHKPDYCTLR